MALGDSITAGSNVLGVTLLGGYRGPLERRLRRTYGRVTFVGTRRFLRLGIGSGAHEGWPGYVLRSLASDPGPGQLYGALAHEALRRHNPNIVLLMAGTNDLQRHERRATGYTLTNIVASTDLLIGQIVTAKPDALLIVAPVVASPKLDPSTLLAFNGGVKALVDAYAISGHRISFAAAMASSVPRDATHFPDGIHPCGAGGYAAIAEAWFQAIRAVLPSDDTASANE